MKKRLYGIWRFEIVKPARCWLICAAAVLSAAICCGVLAQREITVGVADAIMALAVFAVSALTEGYCYGLVAAALGSFVIDYLVTEPRLQINTSLDSALTLGIMLLISLAASALFTGAKKKFRAAAEAGKRVELMYKINDSLLSTTDESVVAQGCLNHLSATLRRAASLYLARGESPQPEIFFAEGADYAWPANRGDRVHYLPLSACGKAYGVIEISLQQGPISGDELAFAQAVSRLAAHALHLQALSAQRQEALVETEAEKARNSFLRGISHDLRTPLTGIIGAGSTLLESGDTLSKSTREKLLSDIQAEAQWLLGMVENMLSVTGLGNGTGIVKAEEAAEEIVAQAVRHFRRRHPGIQVEVRHSSGLLLVPMDATLITRVLGNLLDNAARHAGDESVVFIDIAEESGFAHFTVSDDGPGIPAGIMPRLFSAKPRGDNGSEDTARGHGLGLFICKTIIQAHGGRINACNMPQGGASFTFSLPVGTEVYSNGK